MSIIHNALKKAQKELKNKSDAPISESPEPKSNEDISKLYENLYKSAPATDYEPTPAAKKRPEPLSINKLQTKTPQLLIVLIFLLAITVGFLAYIFPQKLLQPAPAKSNDIVIKPSPTRAYDPNQLVLNGTVITEEKRMALINDELYQIGDTVNGKKIMNITIEQVEMLDEEGKTITLRVKGQR